jgi:hypothetical protein
MAHGAEKPQSGMRPEKTWQHRIPKELKNFISYILGITGELYDIPGMS